jgi:uncharacterized membrane protein YkvI
MDISAFFFMFVLSCVGSGLATGQGVLANVYKMHIFGLILIGKRPEDLIWKIEEDIIQLNV